MVGFAVIFKKVVLLSLLLFISDAHSAVRLKDLARVEETRDSALVGYGIVIGLSGTGDSSRNKMTLNSIQNTLSKFGLEVESRDIKSKNVASVMISADLPPYAEKGDRIDITVSSIGDAKSLAGGTLMLAPIYGVDKTLYGFAQGALTVGGYQFEQDKNSYRKNFSTVARVVDGAIIERSPELKGLQGREVNVVLKEPDFTTASRVVSAINNNVKGASVVAIHPGKIKVEFESDRNLMGVVARLEGIMISPDLAARVVVNERTGTIVSGANVILGAVSIAHGDLKIEITTDYVASQPSLLSFPGDGVRSLVLPDTDLKVTEERGKNRSVKEGTTVADLVTALNEIDLSTRDIITILQAIKASGALHAELIIQ